MNLKYIKSEIYNLGFSDEQDTTPDIVNQAINRAIATISSTVRPITNKYVISQYPIKNQLTDGKALKHYKGEPISYSATGVSYYFECDGTGTATIKSELGETVVDMVSNQDLKSYKGFCQGLTTITFSGEFSYNIKNVAIYNEKISNNEEDIRPFGDNLFYDFKQIAKNKGDVFLSFSDKYKINGAFKPISDFDIIDRHILRLPAEDTTEYTIYYNKLYTPITEETPPETEIELDEDLHILVPLLAAFYVWQDDEERKADKWYNDYETKRNDIIAKEKLNKVVAMVIEGVDYGY